ncbi:Phorbol ester/diacylglycerol-binding protein unc-13 [Hypsibius exemplaris]|uniref:Phorbol ester/diacylglycerol-binding protein unc-13 n=1 Tax=Hypsibius exemplaris TaxID=2072580 RepID=A0A9X6NN02_HYPEX|nr:Phorbol ester/diacylglycerol-binding protein unc-13 [Hypsibius exemplaris]
MSLLCVAVKRGRLNGPPDRFNTYVTLKLENVKSTTVAVKGSQPCWEQEFIFETNRLDTGLVIELWNKGMLWDKLIGTYWFPLFSIPHSACEGPGKWIFLDAEFNLQNGEIVGTHLPSGHSLHVDCRFELPNDIPEGEAMELQKKLAVFNHIMDQEMETLQRQHRRTSHMQNGLSEDSDYTSDVNFPVHHPNSSAHQFMPSNSNRRRDRPPMQKQRSTLSPYYPQMEQAESQSFENSSFEAPYPQDTAGPSSFSRRSSRAGQYGGGHPDDQPEFHRSPSNASDPMYYNSRPQDRLRPSYSTSRSPSPEVYPHRASVDISGSVSSQDIGRPSGNYSRRSSFQTRRRSNQPAELFYENGEMSAQEDNNMSVDLAEDRMLHDRRYSSQDRLPRRDSNSRQETVSSVASYQSSFEQNGHYRMQQQDTMESSSSQQDHIGDDGWQKSAPHLTVITDEQQQSSHDLMMYHEEERDGQMSSADDTLLEMDQYADPDRPETATPGSPLVQDFPAVPAASTAKRESVVKIQTPQLGSVAGTPPVVATPPPVETDPITGLLVPQNSVKHKWLRAFGKVVTQLPMFICSSHASAAGCHFLTEILHLHLEYSHAFTILASRGYKAFICGASFITPWIGLPQTICNGGLRSQTAGGSSTRYLLGLTGRMSALPSRNTCNSFHFRSA